MNLSLLFHILVNCRFSRCIWIFILTPLLLSFSCQKNDDELKNDATIDVVKDSVLLIEKGGLFYYAKRDYEYDTLPINNPSINAAFFTFLWSEIEPIEGQYVWEIIDKYIEPWIKSKKKYALRIMWSTSGYWRASELFKTPTPQWVWDKGAIYAYHLDSETEIPMIWDPVYKEYAMKFLTALAEKYDGDSSLLFIDVTPAAETNPYRFGTINAQDPNFMNSFITKEASNGKTYMDIDWLDVIEDWIVDTKTKFSKTKLLVTLNQGGFSFESTRFFDIGDFCVKNGFYVGQNGLNGDSYLIDSNRKIAFLEWSKKTKLCFEMSANTSASATGTLLEVMEAAKRIHCWYLNVYPTDVLKGTLGSTDFDRSYEEALIFGAVEMGKQ